MKKMSQRLYGLVLIGVLSISQVIIPLSVVAETRDSHQEKMMTAVKNDAHAESGVKESSATSKETPADNASVDQSKVSTLDVTDNKTGSTTASEPAKTDSDIAITQETNITDQLLKKATLTSMDDVAYNTTSETRLLNNTPVKLKLDFEVINKAYPAGSTFVMTLPDNLGFSDSSGMIAGINASWQVLGSTKQLTVTFSQAVTDLSFSIELKSFLYTEKQPQVKIIIGDLAQTTYSFDLYETVDALKYVENKSIIGLDGVVYYNLDRNLSGETTLSLTLANSSSAIYKKQDIKALAVSCFDVDIKGNVIPDSQTELTEGMDYKILSNTVQDTSIQIARLNRQKAYAVSYKFTISLSAIDDHTYNYNKGYPTTGLGSISLKNVAGKKSGISLSAKTSRDEKEIYERSNDLILGGSLLGSKGKYALSIHGMPTEMKAGEKIVITSQNGQPITLDKLSANDASYQSVQVSDYFDVQTKGNETIITAKIDSNLRIGAAYLTVPFNKKDIIVNVSSPLIPGKTFKIVGDDYVEPISIINPSSAETAWGNYYQNGAYSSGTVLNVEASSVSPMTHLEFFVKHPDYLSLREVRDVNFYYKLNVDYTISKVAGGTLVKFTSPIVHSVQFPIGFNYVPDGLPITKGIPVDKIPITIKADDLDPVESLVSTGRKLYSEKTLQGSKNQFLVNARQDTIDNLSVRTVVPKNTDVVFDIYDVSNDQVDAIYPQYWDRGGYTSNLMKKTDAGYPEISFNNATNQYLFNFGTTNKRYVIAYNYANGWQTNQTTSISGYAKDPQNNNKESVSTIQVTNTVTDIVEITQSAVVDAKNLTTVKGSTQSINQTTKKVVNPIFELKSLGNTAGEIDINSIEISRVSRSSYKVKQTSEGVKIIFSDYTLTENIDISYSVISQNAGQISAMMTISSSSIESLSEKERTATSSVTNLQFSAGDSEGIIYKAQALFEVYNREQPTTKIPGVTLVLVNQLTGLMQTIETDQNGSYTLSDIQTGKYTLFVTQAPAGYVIPDAYLSGKEIQLTRNDNQFSIGLIPENDLSSVSVKNTSIYVDESWHAEDNFVSATDRTCAPLILSDLTVTGTVDSSRPGRYEVNYQNGRVHAVAIVTVVSEKTTIVTKDTTIYAGDTWQAEDNFVSATDKTGSQRLLSDLTVTGTVDSNQVGSYDVTYQNGNVSAVATIKVIAKVLEPDKQTDQGDKGKSSMSTVTESKVEKLPQTGDKDSGLIVMIGLLVITYIPLLISKKRE